MKKIIGFIAAYVCYYIGDMFCKLSYLKHNGKYYFDNYKLGYWIADQYQNFMHYSSLIQDWSGNERPWRKIKDTELT